MRLIFTLALLTFASSAAFAQQGPWVSASQMQARLIADSPSRAAIEIRTSPGWHSYWHVPGESGLAPRYDWAGSENLKDAGVLYPIPERMDEMGLTVFGYKGDVTFPVLITPETPEKPVKLALKLDTMVCKDICIPQTLNLTLDMGAGSDAALKPVLDFAHGKVPQAQDHPALRIESAVTGPQAIVIQIYSKEGFDHFDAFVTGKGGVLIAKPEITPDAKDPRNAQVKISAPSGVTNLMEWVGDAPLMITVTNGTQHVERVITY